MAARHNFRTLNIWKERIALAKKIYWTTKAFPKFEIYGLSSKMQISAVSVVSNIAAGTAKGADKHFKQYLQTP